MKEIEINQKWEKEMIYYSTMEKIEKQGEAVGAGGTSEEEISCFLIGADYISS